MAYSPTVTVQIAINAVNLTRQGFGTPIFITTHDRADDRVIDISSADELVTGYGFSTTSNAYIAATQFFTNSPQPVIVQIGRRAGEHQCNLSDPDGTDNETYSISIEYLSTEEVFDASYVTTAGVDDKEAVVDALKTTLDGLTGFTTVLTATKVGTGASASLTIETVDPDFVAQVTTTATSAGTSEPTFTNTLVGTETAADCYTNIKDYNQDFYFVTTEVRSHVERTFVESLADIIQADDKLFFTSSDQINDIDSTDPAVSFFYKAFNDQLTHTVTLWHHEASEFPECYYVGYNAPYDPGSVTWSNLVVTGLPPSSQPTNTAKFLTTTQLGKLIDRNANFIQRDAGINIIRTGVTAGNEWIDGYADSYCNVA